VEDFTPNLLVVEDDPRWVSVIDGGIPDADRYVVQRDPIAERVSARTLPAFRNAFSESVSRFDRVSTCQS